MPASNVLPYSCSFARDGWDSRDWVLARDSNTQYFGGWIQNDDCIQNVTPPAASPDDLCEGRPLAPATYTSMVYRPMLHGDLVVRATMSFDHRMAPLIVLSHELGDAGDGRFHHGERLEVVVFDEGINIWRQWFEDGKPTYIRRAFAKYPLQPRTKYLLEVRKQGQVLSASVAGLTVGYIEPHISSACRAGITGCEGVNRFYDFAVEQV